MDVDRLEKNIELAVNLLKALSNEKRLMIICALYKGEKCVGELEEIVGLSQSALSQHLARLRNDGIVETRRDAQTIYYSLNNAAAEAILKTLYDMCPEHLLSDGKSDGGAVGDGGMYIKKSDSNSDTPPCEPFR